MKVHVPLLIAVAMIVFSQILWLSARRELRTARAESEKAVSLANHWQADWQVAINQYIDCVTAYSNLVNQAKP